MSFKPTLGYPSRTAAVHALRSEGKTTRQIATALGVAVKTISALEQSAQRKRPIRACEEMGRTVVIPVDVLDALKPHADRRKLTVNRLVRDLVAAIADDNLVNAVLGDD